LEVVVVLDPVLARYAATWDEASSQQPVTTSSALHGNATDGRISGRQPPKCQPWPGSCFNRRICVVAESFGRGKHYPVSAHSASEGVVYLRVTMDRKGKVRSTSIYHA
jgi:hypothetical protein